MINNTTGHLMEAIYSLIILGILILNAYQIKMMRSIKKSQNLDVERQNEYKSIVYKYIFDIEDKLKKTDVSVDILLKDFGIFHSKVDCFLDNLSSLPTASPTAPIKTNNWDSMREAFKGPARVNSHE